MSIEAMSSALNLAVGDPTRKLVLIGFANHADKSGKAAFPSLETIAEYACCSKRTVQRHVPVLLAEGYMREGDQRLVSHLPKDRRPVVYDLSMSEVERDAWAQSATENNALRATSSAHGVKGFEAKVKASAVDASGLDVQGDSSESARGDNLTPPRGDNLTPGSEGLRGDTHDTPGVTPVTRRGDTGVTQTVLEPSNEPSFNPPTPSADASGTSEPPTLTLISEVTAPGRQPSFEDFYAIYPRHVGKQAAKRAWDTALRGSVTAAAILEGARRYATDPNLPPKDEERFIPHPASWLRAGRWEDGPLPPRTGGRGRAYNDAETWGTEEERIAHAETKRKAWDDMTEAERQAELDRMFGDSGPTAAHGG